MRRWCTMVAALSLTSSCVCFADIPGKINYHGKITNAQGQLIDGAHDMVFKLFSEATGGAEKWSEAHDGVHIVNGLCGIILGSTNSLTPVFQGNEALYMEISVDGETLLPRQEVTSAGYALNVAEQIKVPVGSVISYAGSSAPAGWLLCLGQAVSRTAYAELFAVIGTTYGSGDGSTTFRIPDGRGRGPMGYDGSDTSFDAMGKTGGAKTHTLAVDEMPVHTHTQNAHTHAQNAHTHVQDPHNHILQSDNSVRVTNNAGNSSGTNGLRKDNGTQYPCVITNTTATNQNATATNQNTAATDQNAGGGEAHPILDPYITFAYIIKY